MAWAVAGQRSQRVMRRLLITGLLVTFLVLTFNGCVAYLDHRDRDRARAALTLYLTRVMRGDFAGAYSQLCIDVLANDYSEQAHAQFHAQFLRSQPAFVSFDLGDPQESTGMDGTYLTFPVHVSYTDGTTGMLFFPVGLQTDGPKVCDAVDWRG